MHVQEREIKNDTVLRLIPRLKDEELKRVQDIATVMNELINPMYRTLASQIPSYDDVSYKRKGEEDTPEFGYYISYFLKEVVEVINYFEVKSLLDLGCGAGIFTSVLKSTTGIKVAGYDNEKVFIERKLGYVQHEEFKLKDITKVTRKELSKYDCVYFWEPIIHRPTCEKFIQNLVREMPDNQYIIYKCDGPAIDYLSQEKGLALLAVHGGFNPIRVYQRKPRKGK